MRDARSFASSDACQRRQHPGVQPRRVQHREGGQFLGPGRQQDISGFVRQVGGGLGGGLQCHTARRQGAGRAQQAVIFHPHSLGRCTDIARCLRGIGVGRVNAERRTAQQCRHLVSGQPTGADCDALGVSLLLGTDIGRHADRDRRAQRRHLAGESAALGRAAEKHHIHTP